MKQEIIIVGSRGLGKEILGYINNLDDYKVVCFLDESPASEVLGVEVIAPQDYRYSCRDAILAIGYPNDKVNIINKYASLNVNWITFRHPDAQVSKFAKVEAGSIIAPYSVIAGDAVISKFTLINCFATVGHDAIIGDYSSLMPYCSVAGNAQIQNMCLLALGAKVLPGVTVGHNCRVSAGVIVNRDVPDDSLAFGQLLKIQPDISMIKSKKVNTI